MNSVMTIDVNLGLLAVFIAAIAASVALFTFVRSGDWRKSDAWKENGKTLSLHAERLTKLETRLENLATKADIAELKGNLGALKAELDGVRGDARAAASGVVRIEQLLMNASDV